MELIWNLCEILFIEVAPGEHAPPVTAAEVSPALPLSFLCAVAFRCLERSLRQHSYRKAWRDVQRGLSLCQVLRKTQVEGLPETESVRQVTLEKYHENMKLACGHHVCTLDWSSFSKFSEKLGTQVLPHGLQRERTLPTP